MVKKGQLQKGSRILAQHRPPLSAHNALAVRLWNFMGGLDWQAVPLAFTLHGVRDVQGMLWRLVEIRNDEMSPPETRNPKPET